MKRNSLLLLFLLLLTAVGASAATVRTVTVGDNVTSADGITDDGLYVLYSGTASTYIKVSGNNLANANGQAASVESVFKILKQSDGTYRIQSNETQQYFAKATHNTAVSLTSDAGQAGSVTLNFNADGTIRPQIDGNYWDRTGGKVLQAYNTVGKGGTGIQTYQIKQVTIEEGEVPYPEEGYVYTINQSRGKLCYQASSSSYWVWANSNAAADNNSKWVFIPAENGTEHSYFIYNVGRKRFIEPVSGGSYSGRTWAFTANKVAVTVDGLDDGTFALHTTDDNVYMSVSTSYVGPLISYYAAGDGGVPFSFEKGDAVTDAILADIDNATSPLIESDLGVKQGYQTTGRGNERTLIHRFDVCGYGADGVQPKALHVTLTEEAAANVTSLRLYSAPTVEMHHPTNGATLLGSADVTGTDMVVPFGDATLGNGISYFFLTATVKDDAAFGAIIDGAITAFDYTLAGEDKSIDIPEALGNPAAQGAKVYGTQSFAWVPTENNNRYYRIPAMILDKDNNIVAVADRRYNSSNDLGSGHKIDLVSKRSLDGGKTWIDENIFAVGDGSSASDCGYGDAALALAPNGDIVCLMAAGNTMFGRGMTHCAISTSSDNGKTWTTPRQLFENNFTDATHGLTNQLGFTNYFTTSGKGLTTKDGVIMYASVVRDGDSTNKCYIIKSTDNGASWTLGPNCAYVGSDESKLIQLNNDSIMVSVRQASARGFNIADKDAVNWGTQYQNPDINGGTAGSAGCNADILYYSRSTEGEADIVLHTYHKSNARENLWLLMSLDEGKTWNDVMQLQPGNTVYSTMVKLPNGDVAFMVEDESYVGGNGWAMTYFTIPAEEIHNMHNALLTKLAEPKDVVIADASASIDPKTQGTCSNENRTYTTGQASGKSGLVISSDATTRGTFNWGNYSWNGNNVRCFVYFASAAGATDKLTITAPDGYTISGYDITAFGNGNENCTLTTEAGESVETGRGYENRVSISESGLKTKQTYITVTSKATSLGGQDYLVMPIFKVYLASELTLPPTGVESVPAAKADNQKTYDLSGRRVAQPQKGGVYIVGGKKVIR